MQRATTITLAIMGGGVALLGVWSAVHQPHSDPDRDCRSAMSANNPNAADNCRRSGGHAGGSGSGASTGNAASEPAGEAHASARGGFGGEGGHAAGGGE